MVDCEALDRLDLVRSKGLEQFLPGLGMNRGFMGRSELGREERAPLGLGHGHGGVLTVWGTLVMTNFAIIAVEFLSIWASGEGEGTAEYKDDDEQREGSKSTHDIPQYEYEPRQNKNGAPA